MRLTRRAIIGAGLAVAGGLALGWRRLFVRHYPPTPYDDVLARLTDRQWAEKFGAAALAALPGFTAESGAARLRRLLGHGGLGAAAERDIASHRLREVGGWVVPESVALIAALAAKLA